MDYLAIVSSLRYISAVAVYLSCRRCGRLTKRRIKSNTNIINDYFYND